MKIKLLFFVLIISFKGYAQDKSLYQTIAKMDSIFFHAYNNCDMATQDSIYADNIEFFHDRSGLDTSKQRVLQNTKKYICGKVRRELIKGSIEVSPLPGYGAVEVGMHMFYNNQEKDAIPRPSRFIIIWKQEQSAWKIAKVISLH